MRYTVQMTGDELIELDEVRQHIKALNDDDEDLLIITPLISAAREYCENLTGCAFCRQTVTAYPEWNDAVTHLPRTPIIAIETVKIYHADGTVDTLTDADYSIDLHDGRFVLNKACDNPRAINPIEVRYEAGYTSLPFAVRQAMLMLIGHWYQHRETIETGAVTSVEVAATTAAILKQYRMWWF